MRCVICWTQSQKPPPLTWCLVEANQNTVDVSLGLSRLERHFFLYYLKCKHLTNTTMLHLNSPTAYHQMERPFLLHIFYFLWDIWHLISLHFFLFVSLTLRLPLFPCTLFFPGSLPKMQAFLKVLFSSHSAVSSTPKVSSREHAKSMHFLFVAGPLYPDSPVSS